MSLHTFFGENSNVAFMPTDPLTISLPLISQVDPTLDEMISRLCMPYRAIKTPVSAVMNGVYISLIGAELGQRDRMSFFCKAPDYPKWLATFFGQVRHSSWNNRAPFSVQSEVFLITKDASARNQLFLIRKLKLQ